MLALAVLIALLGIANTLALSPGDHGCRGGRMSRADAL